MKPYEVPTIYLILPKNNSFSFSSKFKQDIQAVYNLFFRLPPPINSKFNLSKILT